MQEVVLQNNFIGAWFLDDLTICDDLIKYFETDAVVVDGQQGAYGHVDKSAKSCKECFTHYSDPALARYHVSLQKICEEYIKKYQFSVICSPWTIIDCVKIQKYYPGDGFYAWHCERFQKIGCIDTRHLVFMTYLNDVTDEGETEFYYQNLKVRPQKGLTMIWPAEWTHTHRGIPSMTQTKYVITGWYNLIG